MTDLQVRVVERPSHFRDAIKLVCPIGRTSEARTSQHKQADLRRRWLYLMPVVFVTYSLAYLGRSNFGFGAAAGWQQIAPHYRIARGIPGLGSSFSAIFSFRFRRPPTPSAAAPHGSSSSHSSVGAYSQD
jgi:hypothetical protein